MLVKSGLSKSLWAEAVAAVGYLRHRISDRGKKITPYEVFTKKKPFVGHLVAFGTPVQFLINGRRIGKFDAKTIQEFVVGYTDRTNTYRVHHPNHNEVRRRCEVIFRAHSKLLNERVKFKNSNDSVTLNMSPEEREDRPNILDAFFFINL